MRLLEKTALSLEEGTGEVSRNPDRRSGRRGENIHGAVAIIFDRLDFDLSSTHQGGVATTARRDDETGGGGGGRGRGRDGTTDMTVTKGR